MVDDVDVAARCSFSQDTLFVVPTCTLLITMATVDIHR